MILYYSLSYFAHGTFTYQTVIRRPYLCSFYDSKHVHSLTSKGDLDYIITQGAQRSHT